MCIQAHASHMFVYVDLKDMENETEEGDGDDTSVAIPMNDTNSDVADKTSTTTNSSDEDTTDRALLLQRSL